MAYQSEAALEQQFIEQLNKQEYTTVAIPDYDALVNQGQFEAFCSCHTPSPIRVGAYLQPHARKVCFPERKILRG